ncbi:MAG: hypothetical protein Q9208_005068 [Pyrenodesmia sp. 3 TL-2023]
MESTLSGRDGWYVWPLVTVSLSFMFLYVIYGAVWRLYFSPIAHVPGPRLAALTFWNETYYDIVLGGKYPWKIAEYHKAYGPIIRINPYEVHINDPDFFAKLYVGISKGRSAKWPSAAFYMTLQEREHVQAQAGAMISQRGIPVEKSFPGQSLLQALVDTNLLPEAERTPERITAEAQLAMGAGTLNTSHCLRVATYHILASPDVHAKLMQELMSGFPNPDLPPTLDQLEQMPYLRATMYESLRIFHGIAHRLPRVFPDRAIQYQDWIIPPGTPVSMTPMHILDNEDIFPERYRFQPERWLPLDTNGQRLLRYLVTFGGGSRSCVGLELAKAEILTSLACVWRRFGARMRLKDTVRERDVDTVYDIFAAAPSRQDNGVLVVLDEEQP